MELPACRQFTGSHQPQRWYVHQQCRGQASAAMAPGAVKSPSWAPATPSMVIDGRGGYQTKGTAKSGENNLVMLPLQAPVNQYLSPVFWGISQEQKENAVSQFSITRKQEHRLFAHI